MRERGEKEGLEPSSNVTSFRVEFFFFFFFLVRGKKKMHILEADGNISVPSTCMCKGYVFTVAHVKRLSFVAF